LFNDQKRLASFDDEKAFLLRNSVNFKSNICDVGCSTGEFLEHIDWYGQRFGMEINDKARKIAEKFSINFKKTILSEKDFFDIVIFRGTIQHIDDPFNYIAKTAESLKPGGLLVFLATPNIESIYFRLFNELPALEKPKCYFLPGKRHLQNLCERQGFELIASSKPYIGSGYEKPFRDYFSFIARLVFRSNRFSNPFPGNMMNLIFRRVN
jgi:SAM-dependent methyltransferase